MLEIMSIRPSYFMNLGRVLGVLSVVVWMSGSMSAEAAGPIIRSGDSVTIEASQTLEGDFYSLGQSVTVSGEAKNDAYIGAVNATINAPVQEDLVMIAGTAQIHGDIADDVRVLGGEVVVANSVKGDVIVLGGTLKILSTATISGDLIFYGGDVEVNGPVKGSVYGSGKNVRIDSTVAGNVTVRATQSFTLGDAASIQGSVTYEGPVDVTRAQGALVAGTITKKPFVLEEEPALTIQDVLLAVLVVLFSALALFFLVRPTVEYIAKRTWLSFGRLGLIGLGAFLGLPFVSFVLCASVIGGFLGMALLALNMLLILVSMLLVPVVIGNALMHLLEKGDHRISLYTVLVGVGAFCLIFVIPVIGLLLLFAVFLATFGALLSLVYERARM